MNSHLQCRHCGYYLSLRIHNWEKTTTSLLSDSLPSPRTHDSESRWTGSVALFILFFLFRRMHHMYREWASVQRVLTLKFNCSSLKPCSSGAKFASTRSVIILERHRNQNSTENGWGYHDVQLGDGNDNYCKGWNLSTKNYLLRKSRLPRVTTLPW